MTPYEMMLSESQERMLLVAERGREREVLTVFAKWGLDAVEIGRVTKDGLLRVLHRSRIAAEIPAHAFGGRGPVYNRPLAAPPPVANERLVKFGAAGTDLNGNFVDCLPPRDRLKAMDLGTIRLHGAHEHT